MASALLILSIMSNFAKLIFYFRYKILCEFLLNLQKLLYQ
jgi:hypothetical protein